MIDLVHTNAYIHITHGLLDLLDLLYQDMPVYKPSKRPCGAKDMNEGIFATRVELISRANEYSIKKEQT